VKILCLLHGHGFFFSASFFQNGQYLSDKNKLGTQFTPEVPF
jgi:hypothetical protein